MARKVIVSLVDDFDGTSEADETATFESTESPTKSTCPIPTPPSCATRSTSGSLTPAESAAPRYPPADSPRKLLRAHRFGATILLTFVHGPARTVTQCRPADRSRPNLSPPTRLRLRRAEGWSARSWVMFTLIPTSPPAETPVSDTSPDHPPTASSPAVCPAVRVTRPGRVLTGASTEVLNAADHFDPPATSVQRPATSDHSRRLRAVNPQVAQHTGGRIELVLW